MRPIRLLPPMVVSLSACATFTFREPAPQLVGLQLTALGLEGGALLLLLDVHNLYCQAFNYGFDLEDYKNYPCRCGSANCLGYMVAEEFHDHVRTHQVLSASV